MIQDDLHNGGGSNRSSNQIEADIRQTRSRMDSTLGELGERLSARYIMNTALDWWESRTTAAQTQGVAGAKVAGKVLGRQIKAHPMPTMLIGAGIAWLLFKDDEQEHRRSRVSYGRVSGSVDYDPEPGDAMYYDEEPEGPGMADKVKEKALDAKDAVTGAVGKVGDKLSSMTQSASEGASHLREAARDSVRTAGDTVRESAHDVTARARHALYRGRYASRQLGHRVHEGYDVSMERVRRGMDEYPLAAGLGFAALGALLGLVLPHTRREDELLGESSERLVGAVKEQSKDFIDRGKNVVERVAETALTEAQKQGLTPETAASALSGLAGKAGEVLHKVKEEAASAAQEQGLTGEKLKEQAGIPSQSGMGGSAGTPNPTSGSTGQPMRVPDI